MQDWLTRQTLAGKLSISSWNRKPNTATHCPVSTEIKWASIIVNKKGPWIDLRSMHSHSNKYIIYLINISQSHAYELHLSIIFLEIYICLKRNMSEPSQMLLKILRSQHLWLPSVPQRKQLIFRKRNKLSILVSIYLETGSRASGTLEREEINNSEISIYRLKPEQITSTYNILQQISKDFRNIYERE